MEAVRISNPYSKENTQKTQSLVDSYLQLRQQVNALLSPYRSQVIVTIDPKVDLPLKVVHVGDTHWTHDSSPSDSLDIAVDETGKNGLMISHSNLIESVSNKFLSTNTIHVALGLDQQVLGVKAKLEKLDRQHRLIIMSGNMCHEGWPNKTATHDPNTRLASPETPILITGGQVIFKAKGDETDHRLGTLEAYHNPGHGRTNQSPEGSNRARAREEPLGSPNRPGAVISAHTHQGVAGQDVQHSPIDREDHILTYGVVGSPKGTTENSDSFLSAIGVPPREHPGNCEQGLVTIWKNNPGKNRIESYPVAGYKRAETLYEAVTLWDLAASTGNLGELLGQVNASLATNGGWNLIESEGLHRDQDPAAFTEGRAPLYKTLSQSIDTPLPIAIHFLGNLRVGSNSFKRERVKEILKYIDENPLVYYYATRRLVNQNTSLRSDRMNVLKDLSHELGKAKGSLLGFMLTDELRVKRWSHPIDNELEKMGLEDDSQWMPPGDWLYYKSAIKGTPIITQETVSKLKVGEVDYTLYLRDKLSNFTSLLNIENGLTRVAQVWGIDADLLVGGHTEVVGWRTWMRPWGQLEIIVPGGFSEYMEKGIANRTDYPEGGQGVILFPDRKLLYSFPTVAEGQDMHQALVLQEGLKQLRILEKTRSALKKSRFKN